MIGAPWFKRLSYRGDNGTVAGPACGTCGARGRCRVPSDDRTRRLLNTPGSGTRRQGRSSLRAKRGRRPAGSSSIEKAVRLVHAEDYAADRIRTFLAQPQPAIIASVRLDGSRSAWLPGLLDGDEVLVNMDAGRRRLAYLRADPRVSLTVLDSGTGIPREPAGPNRALARRRRAGRHRPIIPPLPRCRDPNPGPPPGQRLGSRRTVARMGQPARIDSRLGRSAGRHCRPGCALGSRPPLSRL